MGQFARASARQMVAALRRTRCEFEEEVSRNVYFNVRSADREEDTRVYLFKGLRVTCLVDCSSRKLSES